MLFRAKKLHVHETYIRKLSFSDKGVYFLFGKGSGDLFELLCSSNISNCSGELVVNDYDLFNSNDAQKQFFKRNNLFLTFVSKELSSIIVTLKTELESFVSSSDEAKICFVDLSSLDDFSSLRSIAKFLQSYADVCSFVLYCPAFSNNEQINILLFNEYVLQNKKYVDTITNNIKPKIDSYATLFKRYSVHYIFILIFSICSSLGWFFFGFYKSPYNYYKNLEVTMTQEQINERIRNGDSVSQDFLIGWIVALLISIALTIICCYGIINFRKVIRNSKRLNERYEKKNQFSMFIIIMIFGLVLTGFGLLVFYSTNTQLIGFYYGNIDIFFTLLIAIVIETFFIFVPYSFFKRVKAVFSKIIPKKKSNNETNEHDSSKEIKQ